MTTSARLTARIAAVLLGFAALAVGASSALAAGVPYTDASSTGSLGLCDKTGHQVTSGSTQDLPLAWTVVSTKAAPTGYTDSKAKATLYMYQPRKDVDPGDWSGYPMTGTSAFSSPTHPMAAFTTGDKRLFDMLQIYPARWDGYVQLRLFFSGTNRVALTQTYPTANLQINGTAWHQVAAPKVDCTAGKAESIEKLLLAPSAFPTPSSAVPSPASADPSRLPGLAHRPTGARRRVRRTRSRAPARPRTPARSSPGCSSSRFSRWRSVRSS